MTAAELQKLKDLCKEAEGLNAKHWERWFSLREGAQMLEEIDRLRKVLKEISEAPGDERGSHQDEHGNWWNQAEWARKALAAQPVVQPVKEPQ